MKKFIVLLIAMTFSIGMHAQEVKTQTQPAMPLKDHLMLKEGKMWVMKDGKTTAMTQDMVMSDGTMVSTSGTVTSAKDGTSIILANGDSVDMDGIVTKYEPKKKDKPKMN